MWMYEKKNILMNITVGHKNTTYEHDLLIVLLFIL